MTAGSRKETNLIRIIAIKGRKVPYLGHYLLKGANFVKDVSLKLEDAGVTAGELFVIVEGVVAVQSGIETLNDPLYDEDNERT